MAYAEVAGLPPVTGLWAVMGPLLVYAVLGSSRQLSVGPESTTALMTATALGALTASGALPGDAAAALAIAVGAVCLVGWLARLGFLANLLSHPILTGYMAGIAVLMIISQLDNFTGIPIPSGNTFTEIGYLLRHLDQIHLPTFGLAVLVLALLIALRRWIPAAPGPLVAVVGSTVVVALFDLQRAGVAVVGEIPAGLPRPALPDFGAIDLAALVGAALGITVVGLHRQCLDRSVLRDSGRGSDRLAAGVLGARRGQSLGRCIAGLPGEQQWQPNGRGRCRRQPHSASFSGCAGGRSSYASCAQAGSFWLSPGCVGGHCGLRGHAVDRRG